MDSKHGATPIRVIEPKLVEQSTIRSHAEYLKNGPSLPMYTVMTVDAHFSGDPIDQVVETSMMNLISEAKRFDKILNLISNFTGDL